MNLKRLTRFVVCALALLAARAAVHDQPAFASRAQETAARPADTARPVAELLRAVEGEGRRDAESWFRLGVAHDAAGDHAAALKAFRQAAKLRTDFALARAGAAYVLYEQGKFGDAEKEATKALAHIRSVDDRVTLSVLGAIRSGRQAQEAGRELARADRELARKPGDARWHLRRATALLGAPSGASKPPPFAWYFEERREPATPDEDARKAAREAARRRFEEAAASYDMYLRLKPKAEDRAFVLAQLEALGFHARGDGPPPVGKVFNQREVNAKAVILSKPDPGFTEQARRNEVTGVVRLRAVLAADGQVRYILAIRSLPHGLTERAVEAARRIRFRPAVINGAPVSQWVTLEYNFNIYY